MPPLVIPLELLLMIAHHIRDDDGELRYDDFNSFLQVNRALSAYLNRELWKEAAEHKASTQRVLTHLLKTNNSERFKSFLELGVDVDSRLPGFEIPSLKCYRGPYTALIVAAASDNLPLARHLLEKGAKVNYFDPSSAGHRMNSRPFYAGAKRSPGPLHAARSAEMVQLLLDHDADPNWKDDLLRPPLIWYACRNDIAAMRAILQRGAEVNPDTPGEKPIHEAAQRSHLDAVKLLVEYGANLAEVQFWGCTPLHLAAQAENIDMVKFLVERWPEGTQRRSRNLETPLHLAVEASTRNADVVKLLVEHWPQAMREVDSWGHTPLHVAACHGQDTEVVRVLVDGWPEGKEALSNDGRTPLQIFRRYECFFSEASDVGKQEMIALLGGPQSEANDR